MGFFLRLLLLAAFAWIGFILLSQAQVQAHLENPDKSRIIMLFGGTVLDGLAIAIILALTVVPAIGQSIASLFFNPGEKIENDPHADAIARLAQGDPEGAIEDYEAILAKDPTDTLALSEIARICCRDLGDTARAATVIEQALDNEWPEEQSSFLANRLADIYLLQEDPVRARLLILQIAENMEGTKFAANAQHRLHEIDRAIEYGHRPLLASDESPEPAEAEAVDSGPDEPIDPPQPAEEPEEG
jgi:tetratricopeptide (TPR) repeat protein